VALGSHSRGLLVVAKDESNPSVPAQRVDERKISGAGNTKDGVHASIGEP
jgi:hypothetical protein